MMKKIFMVLVFFHILFFSCDESFIGKQRWTFDVGVSAFGFPKSTPGISWTLGASFEQQIFSFFSIKAGLNHRTILPQKNFDYTITTVGIRFDTFFYPFRKGLDWLYIGPGFETNFVNHITNDDSLDYTVFSLFPTIGWKQSFFNYVMADFFCSYRIILNEVYLQENLIPKYADRFILGVKFKLNLSKIFTVIIKNRKEK